MRRLFFALLFVLMLTATLNLTPTRTHAAEPGWVVWLFNSNTRDLVKITPDGSQTFVWPFTAMPYSTSDLAISPDNRLAAACLMDDAGHWSVAVAEIETGQTVAKVDYDTLLGCSTTRASFSPDSTQLAFGVVNYFPNDPNVTTSGPVAALQVLDIATAEVASLDFGLEGLTNLFEAELQQPAAAVLPIVVDFDGATVSYQLSIYAVGGNFVVSAERWTINPGFSEQDERFFHPGLQYLPSSGEVVWPDVSNTYPLAQPPGPISATNVVRYHGRYGDSLTIFTPGSLMEAPMLVVGVEWANDGKLVLVHLLGENNPDGTLPEYWVALDRAGNATQLPEDITGFQVVGSSKGFFYLSTTYENGDFNRPTTRLIEATLADDGSLVVNPVWQDNSESWLIASVSPAPAPTDLPVFPRIAD